MKQLIFFFLFFFFFSCKYKTQEKIGKINFIKIEKINYENTNTTLQPNYIVYDSINNIKENNKTILKLIPNKNITFNDNEGIPYDEDRINFKYIGQINILNKYLLKVNSYENTYYLLIDKITGKQDTINGFPHISPDKRILVTYKYNPYETYEELPPPTTDLEFILLGTKGELGKRISKPFKWEIKKLNWKNVDTLAIDTYDHDNIEIYFSSKIPFQWLGNYTKNIKDEEFTNINYNFSITKDDVNLTVDKSQDIQCDGKYFPIENEGILELFYQGENKYCRFKSFKLYNKK